MASRRPKLRVQPNLGRRGRPGANASTESEAKDTENSAKDINALTTKPAASLEAQTPEPVVEKTTEEKKSEDVAPAKKETPAPVGRRRLIKPKVQITVGRPSQQEALKEAKTNEENVENIASVVINAELKESNNVATAKDIEVTEKGLNEKIIEKEMEKVPEKPAATTRRSRSKMTPNLGAQRKRQSSQIEQDEFKQPPPVQRLITSPTTLSVPSTPVLKETDVAPSEQAPTPPTRPIPTPTPPAQPIPAPSPPTRPTPVKAAAAAAPTTTKGSAVTPAKSASTSSGKQTTSGKNMEKTEEKKPRRVMRRTKMLTGDVDTTKLTMRDMIYLNPSANRMKATEVEEAMVVVPTESDTPSASTAVVPSDDATPSDSVAVPVEGATPADPLAVTAEGSTPSSSAPSSVLGSPRAGESAPSDLQMEAGESSMGAAAAGMDGDCSVMGETGGEVEEDGEADDGDEALPVPQVTIGEDGQIIIKESSLTVAQPEVQPTIDDEMEMRAQVEEDKIGYGKRIRNKPWSRKETRKFYIALSSIGTDFTLMQSLFPDRDRTQLKRKFKLEDKKYRNLVDSALSQRKEFDMALFDNLSSSEDEIEEPAAKKKRKQKTVKEVVDEALEEGQEKKKRSRKRAKKSKPLVIDDDEEDGQKEGEEECVGKKRKKEETTAKKSADGIGKKKKVEEKKRDVEIKEKKKKATKDVYDFDTDEYDTDDHEIVKELVHKALAAELEEDQNPSMPCASVAQPVSDEPGVQEESEQAEVSTLEMDSVLTTCSSPPPPMDVPTPVAMETREPIPRSPEYAASRDSADNADTSATAGVPVPSTSNDSEDVQQIESACQLATTEDNNEASNSSGGDESVDDSISPAESPIPESSSIQATVSVETPGLSTAMDTTTAVIPSSNETVTTNLPDKPQFAASSPVPTQKGLFSPPLAVSTTNPASSSSPRHKSMFSPPLPPASSLLSPTAGSSSTASSSVPLSPGRFLSLSNLGAANMQPGQFVFVTSHKQPQHEASSSGGGAKVISTDKSKSEQQPQKMIHVYMVSPANSAASKDDSASPASGLESTPKVEFSSLRIGSQKIPPISEVFGQRKDGFSRIGSPRRIQEDKGIELRVKESEGKRKDIHEQNVRTQDHNNPDTAANKGQQDKVSTKPSQKKANFRSSLEKPVIEKSSDVSKSLEQGGVVIQPIDIEDEIPTGASVVDVQVPVVEIPEDSDTDEDIIDVGIEDVPKRSSEEARSVVKGERKDSEVMVIEEDEVEEGRKEKEDDNQVIDVEDCQTEDEETISQLDGMDAMSSVSGGNLDLNASLGSRGCGNIVEKMFSPGRLNEFEEEISDKIQMMDVTEKEGETRVDNKDDNVGEGTKINDAKSDADSSDTIQNSEKARNDMERLAGLTCTIAKSPTKIPKKYSPNLCIKRPKKTGGKASNNDKQESSNASNGTGSEVKNEISIPMKGDGEGERTNGQNLSTESENKGNCQKRLSEGAIRSTETNNENDNSISVNKESSELKRTCDNEKVVQKEVVSKGTKSSLKRTSESEKVVQKEAVNQTTKSSIKRTSESEKVVQSNAVSQSTKNALKKTLQRRSLAKPKPNLSHQRSKSLEESLEISSKVCHEMNFPQFVSDDEDDDDCCIVSKMPPKSHYIDDDMDEDACVIVDETFVHLDVVKKLKKEDSEFNVSKSETSQEGVTEMSCKIAAKAVTRETAVEEVLQEKAVKAGSQEKAVEEVSQGKVSENVPTIRQQRKIGNELNAVKSASNRSEKKLCGSTSTSLQNQQDVDKLPLTSTPYTSIKAFSKTTSSHMPMLSPLASSSRLQIPKMPQNIKVQEYIQKNLFGTGYISGYPASFVKPSPVRHVSGDIFSPKFGAGTSTRRASLSSLSPLTSAASVGSNYGNTSSGMYKSTNLPRINPPITSFGSTTQVKAEEEKWTCAQRSDVQREYVIKTVMGANGELICVVEDK